RRWVWGAAFLVLVAPAAWAAPSGKVTVAQGVDPTTLDPQDHEETPAFNVLLNIYDTLLVRDKDLKITPWLATSYKLINPTTWEFKLRQGVKFHDGEEFDAEVAKFSLERMANPANNLKMTALRTIDHVDVVDKFTIRVVTKKPFPTLPAHFTLRGAMLPPKYFKEHDKAFLARNPLGSGPFKFVRWVKDDRIELEANEQWWHGAPKIKTLIFRPIPEEATRMSALQTGEVDIATNVPPHLVKTIKDHPKVTITSAPSVRTIFMPIYNVQCEMSQGSYDCTKPYPGPTANPKVRQAINYAVDIDSIIKNVLEGQAIRVATTLTPKHFGYDPSVKPFPYDPAKAKKLLAEAGYPNGIDIVLHAPNGRYPKDKEVAEAVAGQLTQAGIRTELKVYEWTTYMTKIAYPHGGGPIWMIGWGNTTWDADYTYTPMFRTAQVLSNYWNPDFNALLEEAETTMQPAKRQQIYAKVARFFIDDAPVISLYQQIDNYGVSRNLQWTARSDERIEGFSMQWKP
ncbi:MAG TPA: ABC transporter substrate-binding protein, partial [Candidatus Sulfotelmatobacter sp.]|nr:ABC transporter substrate-binding protein [Candidatus Sulfotelmatobacter sp.]